MLLAEPDYRWTQEVRALSSGEGGHSRELSAGEAVRKWFALMVYPVLFGLLQGEKRGATP
jgi:hypothetical protein